MLTGRYTIDAESRQILGEGRVTKNFVTDPFIDPFTPSAQRTLAELRRVAEELGAHPAQVALAWMLGISGIVTGASKVSQVESNLAALELEIPDQLAQRLDEASEPPPSNPYSFHGGEVQAAIRGVSE